jgi:excisionase family DNA binding protein
MTENMLTPKQVAERFNVAQSTVYQWARRGKVPFTRIGKCVRFKPEDIEAFAQTH